MSRSRNRGGKRRKYGGEYWASRLHRHGETPGKKTKIATHRKERRTRDRAVVMEESSDG